MSEVQLPSQIPASVDIQRQLVEITYCLEQLLRNLPPPCQQQALDLRGAFSQEQLKTAGSRPDIVLYGRRSVKSASKSYH